MANIIINDLCQIFKKCISAVLPETLIRNSLKYDRVSQELFVVDEHFNLKNRNVYLVGIGKAVKNMAKETDIILGPKIVEGIISIPKGSLGEQSWYQSLHHNVFYYEGAENNLPDKDAEKTAKKVNNLVQKLSDKDLLLVLISGGGSALLPLPYDQISLDEKIAVIRKLANAGADIKELNTVRKKLSGLKGGQLAIKAQPAQVISLILSDVVGDPLDLIASGPTTPNVDNPLKAKEITKKYKLYYDLPQSIKTVLDSNTKSVIFPSDKVINFIIGSNKLSMAAAFEEANTLNYLTVVISNTVTGNVKLVAEEYVILTKIVCDLLLKKININIAEDKLKELKCLNIKDNLLSDLTESDIQETKSVCLILGGETTVEVKGTGKGGRNQQLALEFSNLLEGQKEFDNFDIFLLSAGTDGIDGPTDAAGAIGYKGLITDSKQDHFNVEQYLDSNNSYNFYTEFKGGSLHVITGHTNTNVMDIHVIIIKLNT